MNDISYRMRLVELAEKVKASRDAGWDDNESLSELNSLLPGTDIDNLCDSDMNAETIIDICLNRDQAEHSLSRDELVALVNRIMLRKPVRFGSEAELLSAVSLFDRNCNHPGKNGLIFYPEEYFDGNQEPTPEEVVDKALSGE